MPLLNEPDFPITKYDENTKLLTQVFLTKFPPRKVKPSKVGNVARSYTFFRYIFYNLNWANNFYYAWVFRKFN